MYYYIVSEGIDVKTNNDQYIIQGLALPFDMVSDNGRKYDRESVIAAAETLKGKPLLFNHNPDQVIGHVTDVRIGPDGLYYEAVLDDGEKDIIRKVKNGHLKFVSIRALSDKVMNYESYDLVVVKKFLELSIVSIPGFDSTNIDIAKESLDIYEKQLIDYVAETVRALGLRDGYRVMSSRFLDKENKHLEVVVRRKLDNGLEFWVHIERWYSEGEDKVRAAAQLKKGDTVVKSYGTITGKIVDVKDKVDDWENDALNYEPKESVEEKKSVDSRYQNPDGTFKKMTCPDDPNGKPSAYCGAVRYFMNVKGMSLEAAKRLAAYIKFRKYGG